MDTAEFKRVLIIKPSSLGDVIHALPVAASIKRAAPGAVIDWVIASPFREIVENSPNVDRAIVFDRNMFKGSGGLGKLVSFVSEIRRYRYSHVIDLQGLLRSGLMSFAARADIKAGLSNAREGATLFYNHKIDVPHPLLHAVRKYLLITESLGVKSYVTEFGLQPSSDGIAAADALLRECGLETGARFAAMAPSARWDAKLWSASGFIELANRLYDEAGVHTVMLGTSGDAKLITDTGIPLSEGVHTLFGRTNMMALVAILKKASIAVANDSGPMHIAAAVGTHTIALFGPTSPEYSGPLGEGHAVVSSYEECAPCFKHECESLKCISNLTVDMVMEQALKLLKEEK